MTSMSGHREGQSNRSVPYESFASLIRILMYGEIEPIFRFSNLVICRFEGSVFVRLWRCREKRVLELLLLQNLKLGKVPCFVFDFSGNTDIRSNHDPWLQVHRLMCTELMKFVDRTSQILPAVESARPRCTMGMQALCSVNLAIEKANSLIQHCAECSKLYLAITGDAILSKCEKVRKMLELSLSQIQNVVPLVLARQISGIVDDLRDAKFFVNPSEEEAGKVMLALLRRDPTASDPIETSEFESFQIAAMKLQLTSPKALLIEKRSIKILLDKVCNVDQTKEKILKYLLYILRMYEKSVRSGKKDVAIVQHEDSHVRTKSACNGSVCGESIELEPHVQYGYDEAQIDARTTAIPPEEFICPISSRLMHDPVVIASGQTFERMWIEKWFSEGNNTCPKTQDKLPHLSVTPNPAIKDLISKWSRKHGIPIPDPCSRSTPGALSSWKSLSFISVAGFGSSLNDMPIHIDVSSVSLNSSVASYASDSSHDKIVDALGFVPPQMNSGIHGCQSSVNSNRWIGSGFLSKLAELPWESRCKVVADVKNQLKEDDQAFLSLFSDSSVQSLIRFMEDACCQQNVKAQADGAQVLLALVSNCRNKIPSLSEHEFHLLASFIDSEITEEAISILEVLSVLQDCKSKIMASGAILSILKILDTQISDSQVSAVKILYNLSLNRDIGSHIQSLGCITKLIPLLGDSSLAGYSIKIIRNLSDTEGGRVAIAETNGCIASIAELLETGSQEEQEHGVAVLLSLCLQRTEYCLLVLREGIVPPLVNITVNGNARGKDSAMELLRILRDVISTDSVENSLPHPGAKIEFSQDSHSSKEKKSSYKSSGFFRRKLRVLSKPRSLALF
ncbi:U-box domain-containing protein 5-like [Macadamia integrifolia]|uniref:U-box domain-containing protein 5-like n=1 Tax=Macadamia integrifolia TaxID=60698 RepID=UPI001C4FA220|nr:U-box domain-containing protein 5-like [Macadamia integrifolia]